MDKLSLKVLRYISKSENVNRSEIISKFGDRAKSSINYLYSEKYIESGQTYIGLDHNRRPVSISNGVFQINSKGRAYLEEHPGKAFDRWLTRFCAIWGAITGTAAIIVEIWLHFLSGSPK